MKSSVVMSSVVFAAGFPGTRRQTSKKQGDLRCVVSSLSH